MKFGKIWGTTRPILVTPLIEIHEIEIQPRSRCSEHRHRFKWNAFYCLDGLVEIHARKEDYALTDVTVLRAGESVTVPPGETHWFETITDGAKVLEIYYLHPLDVKDIVRDNTGGTAV